MTTIKQEMANQDRTKIGPFFDFLQHFRLVTHMIAREHCILYDNDVTAKFKGYGQCKG